MKFESTSLTDRFFRHMIWANSYVFDQMSKLSETELLLTAPKDDWTAAGILEHLTAPGYAYRLDGLAQVETFIPKNSLEVIALKEISTSLDERLRESAKTPEGFVEYKSGEKVIRRARQTILAQSIHHATEHRTQIAGIYAAHGMKIIDLDFIDLWEFADQEGLGD